MSNIELLIGQSSTEAERKRAARLQNKALSALRTSGGHLSDIRPPEIELEKEIEINREIEKGHPAPAYGCYQNVFLTDGEPVSYTHLDVYKRQKINNGFVYFFCYLGCVCYNRLLKMTL